MKTFFSFLVLAVVFNQALSRSLRDKRQSSDEDDLEDRYGFENSQQQFNQRPFFPGSGFPDFGQQRPNQGQFPGQNQGQFPNQNQGQFPGQNQGQFPGQGQNQGQFPNQNQGQFPGQGQNQGQFPGQGQNQGQFPGQGQNQGQNQGQQPATTTPSPSAAIIQQCVRACPVTPEYNPVCGSNNVTYSNPGRLICAQNCGENVTATRQAPCPTPAPVVPSN